MTRWARYALPVGVAGVVVCAAVAASTYLPGAPYVPGSVAALLFLGIFPLHLGSVLTLRRLGPDRRGLIAVLRRLPPAVIALTAASFVGFWLVGMTSLLGDAGSTEERAGRYYASDHGELTEISEDQYDERRAAESRLFAAVPGAFYAVGAAVGFLARTEAD
jgi:hypothetical protein